MVYIWSIELYGSERKNRRIWDVVLEKNGGIYLDAKKNQRGGVRDNKKLKGNNVWA